MKIIEKTIDEKREEAIKNLRQRVYRHITQACRIPEWKQCNYIQEYIDLRAKKNAGSITAKELSRLHMLQQVFSWKDSLIAQCNEIEDVISKATDTRAIHAAMSGLNLTPPPVRP